MWNFSPGAAPTEVSRRNGEIALEVAGASTGADILVTAYRNQNGQLGLASYDANPDAPTLMRTASAGAATDISICALHVLRVLTAVRSGGNNVKLIVWDLGLDGGLTRRGDITPARGSQIQVTGLSATMAVVAFRNDHGQLELRSFRVSADGVLTQCDDYILVTPVVPALFPQPEVPMEIKLGTLSSSRVAVALRQTDGTISVQAFDVSNNGILSRRGHAEGRAASDIDFAVLNSQRAVVSMRSADQTLVATLFEIDADGFVTRRGSYESLVNPHRFVGQSAAATSVVQIGQSRFVIGCVNADGNPILRTIEVRSDFDLHESAAAQPEHKYSTVKLVRTSGSAFAVIGRIDGEIWTGNGYGLLGGNTGDSVCHLDPLTKIKLGWLTPTEVTRAGSHTLSPVSRQFSPVLLIRNPNHRASEYFLVEVRNKESIYESGLKDEGLAIWHVDETRSYPEPFTSLQWLRGSPETALWADGDPGISVYDDDRSPAGARWNDFSPSGISVTLVRSQAGAITISVGM